MPFPSSVELPLHHADAIANHLAATLDPTDRPEVHDAWAYLASEVAVCVAQDPLLPDSHAEEPVRWGP